MKFHSNKNIDDVTYIISTQCNLWHGFIFLSVIFTNLFLYHLLESLLIHNFHLQKYMILFRKYQSKHQKATIPLNMPNSTFSTFFSKLMEIWYDKEAYIFS